MLLKDKVVIVTGVGPGLGYKLSLLVAREGAKVVMAARSKDYLAEVAAEIRQAGGACEAVPTDVSDPAACQALVDAAVKKFGTVNGLVNSAFAAYFSMFEDTDLTKWRPVMDVNCFGAAQMAQAALPHMRAAGGGSIVNVGTMAVREINPGRGAYCVSKAALGALTRQLATELGKYRIRANMTWMGWMLGQNVKNWIAKAAAERGVTEQVITDEIIKNIPLGFMPPDEECAKAVVFFLSDYASVVTGASLDVNGGEYMPL